MRKGGPKPLPTNIIRMHGTTTIYKRTKRERELSEKPIEEPCPSCPAWLNDTAKQKWSELAPKLHRLGLLTEAYTESFARYCDTLAQWHKMREFIEKYGMVYPIYVETKKVDEKGEPVKIVKCFQQFPQVGIYNRLTLVLCRIEAEFGLTPSARAGMAIPRGKSRDEEGLDKAKFWRNKIPPAR